MAAAFANVLAAAVVLVALPLFFAGFILAPLIVLAVGFAIFTFVAPD